MNTMKKNIHETIIKALKNELSQINDDVYRLKINLRNLDNNDVSNSLSSSLRSSISQKEKRCNEIESAIGNIEELQANKENIMNKQLKQEIMDIEKIIGKKIEDFDGYDWNWISKYQKLSESFIEKYNDKVFWFYISIYQKLSESFIEKYKEKLDLDFISRYQILSESFIERHKDKLDMYYISRYQKLSKKFQNKYLNIDQIKDQKERFYPDNFNPIKNAKEYAKKYKLKIDDEYIYCYRNHDINNCGMFNKTISYQKEKYYKDWRIDLNPDNENSFGYGIFPKGNTKVKVKLEDFGIEVNREDGKGRVLGFEIVDYYLNRKI